MSIRMDYLDGYTTLGGSFFANNVHGIVGSATLWRNMIVTSEQVYFFIQVPAKKVFDFPFLGWSMIKIYLSIII